MEHTPKSHAELEVTGVSRSGRVCKKSSKLMDFQSPDDISDAKQKKAHKSKAVSNNNTSGGSSTSIGSGIGHLIDAIRSEHGVDIAMDEGDIPSDSGDDMNDSPMDSDDDDALDIEDLEVTQDDEDKSDGELVIEMPSKRSVYMSEKSSKYKKMLKDGKVVMGKAQRKDKGKRRFTAYMLWAKEARKQMMTNPDLDFGSMSKRLGEMWANVPNNQKYNWKRRARRIAKKFKQDNEKALQVPYVKRFLHLEDGAGASRSAAANVTTPVAASSTGTAAAGGGAGTAAGGSARSKKAQSKAAATMISTDVKPEPKATAHAHHSPESPVKGGGHTKLPGCQPTDVAAHLKLLGDSLTIIGERLKEHEGQIAVSGSLSVLLDSLLCSLGPLMCLSIHIPELKPNAEQLKELFQNTLDNIAYVMPGL